MIPLLTHLSRIPGLRRIFYRRLQRHVTESFARGNTVVIFFAEQYYLTDHAAIADTLSAWDPSWEIGFIPVDWGSGTMTVFFVSKTLQDLWDGVSLYKNALTNRWLAFHVANYQKVILKEAQKRSIMLQTDEIMP